METLDCLYDFFKSIEKDFRISTTHIAVYAALLKYRVDKNYINPIQVFRHEITPLAKISSPYTYHKTIKELSAYGYLKYVPSNKKTEGSIIYFPEEKDSKI